MAVPDTIVLNGGGRSMLEEAPISPMSPPSAKRAAKAGTGEEEDVHVTQRHGNNNKITNKGLTATEKQRIKKAISKDPVKLALIKTIITEASTRLLNMQSALLAGQKLPRGRFSTVLRELENEYKLEYRTLDVWQATIKKRYIRKTPIDRRSLPREQRQSDSSLHPGATTKGSTTYTSFDTRIEQLISYKAQHNHMKVTKEENKSLFYWCQHIRRARRGNSTKKNGTGLKISIERIAILDNIGFYWGNMDADDIHDTMVRISAKNNNKDAFQTRIEELRQYKSKHGHINVRWVENKLLANFCSSVRHARENPTGCKAKSTKLTTSRIAALDELGFDWTRKRDWSRRKVVIASELATTVHVVDRNSYKAA